MKKILATILTLTLLLMSCAFAEEIPAVNWEDAESAATSRAPGTSSMTSPSNTGSPTSLRTWISPRRTARRCSPSMSCLMVPRASTRSI